MGCGLMSDRGGWVYELLGHPRGVGCAWIVRVIRTGSCVSSQHIPRNRTRVAVEPMWGERVDQRPKPAAQGVHVVGKERIVSRLDLGGLEELLFLCVMSMGWGIEKADPD